MGEWTKPPWFHQWLSSRWWSYLLAPKNAHYAWWEVLLCRMSGHPAAVRWGPTWVSSPAMGHEYTEFHCNGCGDEFS